MVSGSSSPSRHAPRERDFLRLVIVQPLVRESDGVGLPVDMGQRHAIGIDDTIAAGDRLESPWSRKAALRHTSRIS